MEMLVIGGVVVVVAVIWSLVRADQSQRSSFDTDFYAAAMSASNPAPTSEPEAEGRMLRFDTAIEVVGESHYQAALLAVSGGKTPDGPERTDHVAQLVLEPTNPYDRNAVRVEIDGRLVGYLPKAFASRLAPTLRELAAPAFCQARITGGWDRGRGDTGSFGVVLLDQDGDE